MTRQKVFCGMLEENFNETLYSSNLHKYKKIVLIFIFSESCSGTTNSTTEADVSSVVTPDTNATVSSQNASLTEENTQPREETSTTLTTEETTTLNSTADNAILTTTGLFV